MAQFTQEEEDDISECLKEYDDLKEQNVYVENILSDEHLNLVDNILMNHLEERWRKVAYIIGATLDTLEKEKNIQKELLWSEFSQFDYILLAQRLETLEKNNVVEIAGNVGAMRFSEVKKI